MGVMDNRPGLSDQADWKAVMSVPDTASKHPDGKHWAALLRLFSWEIQRVAELEERLAKVEADLARVYDPPIEPVPSPLPVLSEQTW